MKKTYIKPTLDQVIIETESMIAASGDVQNLDVFETEATGPALSKDNRFDLWAEDPE